MKTFEYATAPSGTVHLADQETDIPWGDLGKTLCDQSLEGMPFGDETQSGIAATCLQCRMALARSNPKYWQLIHAHYPLQPAYELIGHQGVFRLPNGRTLYEAVMYDDATAKSDRPRLARLDGTSPEGIRQINRYVDWDQPIEVIADYTVEDNQEKG
jgi:hypothetical protein